MKISSTITLLLIFLHSTHSQAFEEPDWSENAEIPKTGRANPYQLSKEELENSISIGKRYTLDAYPVEITGALVPYRPLEEFFNSSNSHPLRDLLQKLFKIKAPFQTLDDLYAWLGLHEYPLEEEIDPYHVPFPASDSPNFRMGVTFIERGNTKGMTFSCATCHSGNLFGKKVIGLTNRFPRAMRFFVDGKKATASIPATLYRAVMGATREETEMYRETRNNMRYVKSKEPLVLGLDTSMAHTALSLAKRSLDEHATKKIQYALFPRHEALENRPADSKPAVWWNLKYKTRWLSDGSIVSGSPLHMVIMTNEIGRGTDLEKLETWFDENERTMANLTNAVFSTQAPKFTDFFPASHIDINRAKNGQAIYNRRCANCHGKYQKAWDLPDAQLLPLHEQLETIQVQYHKRTPVYDVGTDSNRANSIESIEQYNRLAISKKWDIKTVKQEGYIPPPLVGIWARWPYFHNNSVPSLCAVLSRHEERPKSYFAGEANDPEKDFDPICNGYPLGDKVPTAWRTNTEAFFDTTQEGLGNFGHDEGIFLENGEELLTKEEKLDVVQFLQTL